MGEYPGDRSVVVDITYQAPGVTLILSVHLLSVFCFVFFLSWMQYVYVTLHLGVNLAWQLGTSHPFGDKEYKS